MLDSISKVVRRNWLIAGVALLATALFLSLSALQSGWGFPLDDGWIHQTYARNLARSGRWEYVPGQVSTGSTAPLWTLLLAVGYLFRLPHLFSAYLLGALCLVWLSWSGMALFGLLWPQQEGYKWVIGLVLVLTWPLVWAAASGMETLLFIALGLNILVLYGKYIRARSSQAVYRESPYVPLVWLVALGILSGLLILTRPDGLVLLFLITLALGSIQAPLLVRLRTWGIFLGTASLPLLPYFVFNLAVSGSIWPNTFYAKQAEYAAELAQPFLTRFLQLLFFSLGGPSSGWQGMSNVHLLLLPGLVAAAWRALKADWAERRIYYLLPLLWATGHVFLYAWRLPVTYQHGRYLFAAIPLWVLYGLVGWRIIFSEWMKDSRMVYLGRQVAVLTFWLLLLLFLLLGAQAYATDVAFIEGEMVEAAYWLAENTSANDLVAAHDIGAIGYFAERPLLDLAGLISPEVIPILTDETAMAQHIFISGADYLVTAPGWPYSTIVSSKGVTFVYSTDLVWTQEQGFNNSTIYRINP